MSFLEADSTKLSSPTESSSFNIMKVTYPMEKLDAILNKIAIAIPIITIILKHIQLEKGLFCFETYIIAIILSASLIS